jgi:hypothetical protein
MKKVWSNPEDSNMSVLFISSKRVQMFQFKYYIFCIDLENSVIDKVSSTQRYFTSSFGAVNTSRSLYLNSSNQYIKKF